MSIKTKAKASAVILFLALTGTTTQAAPGDAIALARDFATCQGRYAAQVDYDGLMGRETEEAVQHAAMFAELVETVMPMDADPDARKTIYASHQGALGVHWNLLLVSITARSRSTKARWTAGHLSPRSTT